ncbi:dipeptidase [Robertmurraya korlensis]|uniref:dipeptidase n=1 Tax=Robertmurraya korlensis TaxID=519977 RepID=UPI0008243CBA|nr:membrane dipeptidase [Robertmurraya korlensis]
MKIFDAHSDIWENVDEKRARGLKDIIDTRHRDDWKKGEIFAGFYPIWVNPFSEVPTHHQALRIIKNMAIEIQECKEHIKICTTYRDIVEAQNDNKHGIILGSEGLSYIGEDIDQIDILYLLGMRTLSLTWNEENALATGVSGNSNRGLTAIGKRCINKIEKMNIIIDLAHANSKTFWDVMESTTSPIIVSHGNSKAIYDIPRNYTDKQLEEIAKRNGVIGVNAFPAFLAEKKEDRTVSKLVDHIDHMVNVMGIDHVGLGMDLVYFLDDYGIDLTISDDTIGLEKISKAQNVVEELRKRSFRENEIEKITSLNFLRVLEEVLI